MVHPYVYLIGGYQSPSIILTDPFTGIPVSLGGMGSGPWDTILQPGKKYDFSVEINLSSIWPITDDFGTIKVRFWEFDGGVGSSGNLIDTKVIDFWGPVDFPVLTVTSGVQFEAALLGIHKCAVVSISNLIVTDLSGNNVIPGKICIDATDSPSVPDPGLAADESCSAWRNTDSRFAGMRDPWTFNLGLGKFNPKINSDRVELEIHTHHVPIAWHTNKRIVEIKRRFREVGIQSKVPYYLLPGLKGTLERVDLKIKIDNAKHLQSEKGQTNFLLDYKKDRTGSFEVKGVLPSHSQEGDVLLINVIAHYKTKENKTIKSIGFLEVLHVIDKDKYKKEK